MSAHRVGVLFIGEVRYSQPLDHTSAKKFARLSQKFACYVTAFSRGWRPAYFRQHALFFLFPLLPASPLRYGVLALGAFLIGMYLCLKGAVQIIVAQSPYEGLAGVLIRRASRMLGRRVALVTEVHGDWEESLLLYKRVPFPRLYRFTLTRLAAHALRQSDLIRAVSPFTRDKVGKVVPGKMVFTFPGYTDIELFLAEPAVEPQADAPVMVLFVGALVYLKGVHNLIAAMAALGADYPQARLVIVGQGGHRAELEKLAERLGLSGKVTFTGELPQPLLQKYMQQCRMLVLPSLSEGLGLVLAEAMACGKPVIGTAVGGIPELIEDGVNGFLVPPDDVEPLAGCIKKLLADGELARRMGRRGRDFVARTFSTERYVAGYAEVVEYAARLAAGLK